MTKEISLTSLEDTFILNGHKLSRRRPGLYPSEASVVYFQDEIRKVDGKCLREAWYRNMNYPKSEPATPKLRQTADLGKWDEEGVIDRWKKMGLWIGNNIKFYRQDLVLSGELDAVLKILGRKIGYEIKTFYGHYTQRHILGAKRPEIPGKPKENQLLQALVYSWEYRDELDEYRMYYLERGSGERAEFEVGCEEKPGPNGVHQCYYRQIPGDYWNQFNEDKVYLPFGIEDIHDRYKDLIKYIREEKMPPRDFEAVYDTKTIELLKTKGIVKKTAYEKWQKNPKKYPIGAWQCGYCFYKSKCKADSIKEAIDK